MTLTVRNPVGRSIRNPHHTHASPDQESAPCTRESAGPLCAMGAGMNIKSALELILRKLPHVQTGAPGGQMQTLSLSPQGLSEQVLATLPAGWKPQPPPGWTPRPTVTASFEALIAGRPEAAPQLGGLTVYVDEDGEPVFEVKLTPVLLPDRPDREHGELVH